MLWADAREERKSPRHLSDFSRHLEASLPEDLLTRQPDMELREQEKLHGDPVGAQGSPWQVEGSLVRLVKGVSH